MALAQPPDTPSSSYLEASSSSGHPKRTSIVDAPVRTTSHWALRKDSSRSSTRFGSLVRPLTAAIGARSCRSGSPHLTVVRKPLNVKRSRQKRKRRLRPPSLSIDGSEECAVRGHTRPSSYSQGHSSRRFAHPSSEGCHASAMQRGKAPLQAPAKRCLEELGLVAERIVVDRRRLRVRRLSGRRSPSGSDGARCVRPPRRAAGNASPAARTSSRSSRRRTSPQHLNFPSDWYRFTAQSCQAALDLSVRPLERSSSSAFSLFFSPSRPMPRRTFSAFVN